MRIGNKYTGKYGYINKKGKEVIPVKYDWVANFSKGLAAVRIGDEYTGKRGLVNKKGKKVIPVKYDWSGNFSEDLAAVKLNGKWGFISR